MTLTDPLVRDQCSVVPPARPPRWALALGPDLGALRLTFPFRHLILWDAGFTCCLRVHPVLPHVLGPALCRVSWTATGPLREQPVSPAPRPRLSSVTFLRL